jgi:hypothetical protein
MEEIRGAAAVRYARELNIFFNIDERFLADAEGEMSGRRTSIVDFYEFLREQTGIPFNPAEIVPGKETFDFLINRHGDGWIYVAREGKDPEAEEKQALRLFHRLLEEREPAALIDVRYLHRRYRRVRFDDTNFTGFPHDARLNLLFHAALRLVGKGALEAVEDEEPLPAGQAASYGRRRFAVPRNVQVSLVNVLCERCRRESVQTSMSLHGECARRLKQALRNATRRVGNPTAEAG